MRDQDYSELLGKARILELDLKGRPTPGFIRLAIAILLWEMANSDGNLDPKEFNEIIRNMDHEFHIMDEDVGQLLEEAQYFRSKSGELEQLFREINLAFNSEQRTHLFELIWNVARADGKIDMYERAFGNFLRVKLNVSNEPEEK